MQAFPSHGVDEAPMVATRTAFTCLVIKGVNVPLEAVHASPPKVAHGVKELVVNVRWPKAPVMAQKPFKMARVLT